MRRAIVVLLAVAATAATAPQASAASRCRVKGTRVIQRVGRVVVLGSRWGPTYGCLTTTHERRLLPVGDDSTRPAGLRVRGTVVGYWMNAGCFGYCWSVVTVDLHTGRRSIGYRSYEPVERLVIDRFGHAAWTDYGSIRELHVMDDDGEEVVARDASIDRDSLRLGAGELRWRAAGTDHSRRLDQGRPCGLHGSATLARSDTARVYWIGELVYGCFAPTERRTLLGRQPVFDMEYYGGRAISLAGHYASIDEGYAGRGDPYADLRVYDLATGKVVRRWYRFGDAEVLDAKVTTTGAVGWIDLSTSPPRGAVEVRASDAAGNAVVLDSGDVGTIDPASLQIDGSTLSWVHAGERRSAVLR